MNVRRVLLAAHGIARGRPITGRFDDLINSQWLSPAEIKSRQWQDLSRLIDHCHRHVPYYRQSFQAAGVAPDDLRGPEDLPSIPLLARDDIRLSQSQLVAVDRPRQLYRESTSGSTGAPLSFGLDDNFVVWAEADHYRHYSWSGWRIGEPIAFLWRVKHRHGAADLRRRIFQWLTGAYWHDGIDLSPARLDAFAAGLQQHRPTVIVGYANALYTFARHCRARGWRPERLRGIESTAEMLHPWQRTTIEDVFGCRVFDSYGSKELRDVAHECEQHAGTTSVPRPATSRLSIQTVVGCRPASWARSS